MRQKDNRKDSVSSTDAVFAVFKSENVNQFA